MVGAPQRSSPETIILGAVQTQNTEMMPPQRPILYIGPRRDKTDNVISKQVIIDSGPWQLHGGELMRKCYA